MFTETPDLIRERLVQEGTGIHADVALKRVNAAHPYGVRLWDADRPATRWTYDSARASTTRSTFSWRRDVLQLAPNAASISGKERAALLMEDIRKLASETTASIWHTEGNVASTATHRTRKPRRLFRRNCRRRIHRNAGGGPEARERLLRSSRTGRTKWDPQNPNLPRPGSRRRVNLYFKARTILGRIGPEGPAASCAGVPRLPGNVKFVDFSGRLDDLRNGGGDATGQDRSSLLYEVLEHRRRGAAETGPRGETLPTAPYGRRARRQRLVCGLSRRLGASEKESR